MAASALAGGVPDGTGLCERSAVFSGVARADHPEGRIGAAGELGQVVAETEGHGPCIVGSVQIADPPKFGMRVDDVSLLVVVTHRALYLASGVVEGRCGGPAREVGTTGRASWRERVGREGEVRG